MNLLEISNKFPTEIEAIKYFEKVRFGKKVKCPSCESTNTGNRTKDDRWHCGDCNSTFSVTTGTYLHNTRLPLKTWLYAFAVISDAKKGISAKQLERNLGVHYETAWTMYHTIRDLMSIENDGITLNDIVEMDTTQIDKDMRKCQVEAKGEHGHIPELDEAKKKYEKMGFEFNEGDYKKPCKIGKQKPGLAASDMKIGGAVTRDGDVVAAVLSRNSFAELRQLIDKHVNKSRKKTVLITDQATEYNKMKTIINHIKIDHSKLYSYRGINSNTIESFWAVVQRQIKGQHHHVSVDYLDKYVAETVFKFNNRKRDDMFETLVKFSMLNK
jgi:transposase-like protein